MNILSDEKRFLTNWVTFLDEKRPGWQNTSIFSIKQVELLELLLETEHKATLNTLAIMSDEKMVDLIISRLKSLLQLDEIDRTSYQSGINYERNIKDIANLIYQDSQLHFKRKELEAVKEAKKEGIELLKKSVNLIKSWHELGVSGRLPPNTIKQMWDTYYEKSPEMKEIREALQEEQTDKEEE